MARRNWFLEHWKGVIFSDKSLFSLFPSTGRVYVLRQPKEAFQSTVKYGGGSVMIWGVFISCIVGLYLK